MFFQRNLSFLFLRKLLAFPPHPPSSFSFSCQWTLAWSVSEHTSTMVKQPSQGAVLQELLCALELQETWVKVYVCMYIYSCVCILSRKKYLFWHRETPTYVAEEVETSERLSSFSEWTLSDLRAIRSANAHWAAPEPALARHTRESDRPDCVKPVVQGRASFLPSIPQVGWNGRGWVLTCHRFLRN